MAWYNPKEVISMRKKMPENEKRNRLIGIKVKENTREKLEYIADREQVTLSTLINGILVDYIENYLKIAKIDWEEVLSEDRNNAI